ncbi:MAG: NBR1-Ig-like domain-containing protein [Candidatus Rokuibacteriota bacterium]
MARGIPAVLVRAGPYLLLAALILLRAVNPRADAPYFLDWSGGLYFDEGAYTHNARNKLLFGEWRLDEWNNMYYSPLHNLLLYLVFSVAGIGYLQERSLAIVLSGASLVLFYLALRTAFGLATAVLGALLLGTNYLFVMFGRLGLLEIPVTFAAVLTLYGFGRAVATRRPAWYAFAGAASFLVYVFKSLGVYIVGAALVAVVYETVRDPAVSGPRVRASRVGAYVAGLASAALLWAVVFYLPHRTAIAAIGSLWLSQSLPATGAQLLSNVATQPLFVALSRVSVVAVLGVLGGFLVAYLALRARERLHGLDVLAGAWLLAGGAFLSVLSYRPVRYYVPLIPPLVLLAVRLATRALRPIPLAAATRRDPWLYLGVFLAALTVGFFGLVPYLRWDVGLGARFLVALAGAAGAVVLAGLLLRAWADGPRRLLPLGWVALALLAVSVGRDLAQYRRWEQSPSLGMVGISRELGRHLDRAVIAGLSAPALVLENRHRAIYAGREGWFDSTPDLFQRHPDISHLLLATYNAELHWYYRTFPDVMARARLLKTYHVWKTHLFLYTLREGESPRAFHPAGETGAYDAAIEAVEVPFAVEPGQVFSATLAVRNAGRQPWRAGDRIGLGARENRDAFAAPRHYLADGRVAAPDDVVTFSLPMRAPTRPDLYVSSWQMVREGELWFGEPYLGVIWVKEPA